MDPWVWAWTRIWRGVAWRGHTLCAYGSGRRQKKSCALNPGPAWAVWYEHQPEHPATAALCSVRFLHERTSVSATKSPPRARRHTVHKERERAREREHATPPRHHHTNPHGGHGSLHHGRRAWRGRPPHTEFAFCTAGPGRGSWPQRRDVGCQRGRRAPPRQHAGDYSHCHANGMPLHAGM